MVTTLCQRWIRRAFRKRVRRWSLIIRLLANARGLGVSGMCRTDSFGSNYREMHDDQPENAKGYVAGILEATDRKSPAPRGGNPNLGPPASDHPARYTGVSPVTTHTCAALAPRLLGGSRPRRRINGDDLPSGAFAPALETGDRSTRHRPPPIAISGLMVKFSSNSDVARCSQRMHQYTTRLKVGTMMTDGRRRSEMRKPFR